MIGVWIPFAVHIYFIPTPGPSLVRDGHGEAVPRCLEGVGMCFFVLNFFASRRSCGESRFWFSSFFLRRRIHFGKFIQKALLATILVQHLLAYIFQSLIVILILILVTIITYFWGFNSYWLLFYISLLTLLCLWESYLVLSNFLNLSYLLLHNKLPPHLVTKRTNINYLTISTSQESEHSLAGFPISAVARTVISSEGSARGRSTSGFTCVVVGRISCLIGYGHEHFSSSLGVIVVLTSFISCPSQGLKSCDNCFSVSETSHFLYPVSFSSCAWLYGKSVLM